MSPRLRPRAVETVSHRNGLPSATVPLDVSKCHVSSDDVLNASLGQVWLTEGEGEDGGDDDVAAGVGDGAAGEDRLGDRWAV
jgi:hypothetical protein